MGRLWNFLADRRVLFFISFIGIALIAIFFLLSMDRLKLVIWIAASAALLFVLWAFYWFYQRRKAKQFTNVAIDTLEQRTDQAEKHAAAEINAKKAKDDALKKRLLQAIRTICTSKLGETSGRAALYELPWYIMIGSPAAGKSSAILKSGLKFPLANSANKVIPGIDDNRNCDWIFTSEGILLDTTGGYSVYEEARNEWLGLLGLLKKYRPKVPINGVILAVSITELASNQPEQAVKLATQLRQRIQELIQRLEVIPPVYVIFTKADMISGFVDFFDDSDVSERERVWGASLPYDADGKADAVQRFDENFDLLHEGLKELAITRMSANRRQNMPSGLLTFPIEFAALRYSLRSFIGTLFEDNSLQFKPLFRGFYFTSAVQKGQAVTSSHEHIANRFWLQLKSRTETSTGYSSAGFFLRQLFSDVIFADRNLVKQYTTRIKQRLRYGAFFTAVTLFGLALGASGWSYVGNRQLAKNVEIDLQTIAKLQESHVDLQSQLKGLEILQDRIEQLRRYHDDRPLSLTFGLYQGDLLERKLRNEYYTGIRELMLKPTAAHLELFLNDVNAHANEISMISRTAQNTDARLIKTTASEYRDASPTSTEDAYNALKSYLMLANREHMEIGHLNDQITRYWRSWLEANRGNMSKEEMLRSAGRLITFYLSQVDDATLPMIENKLALVEQTRETLRAGVDRRTAAQRVYVNIKARASTRFPPMTVARILDETDKDIVAGSYVISGTFTREAWEKYVQGAIREAANGELQNADWVLNTNARSDLTLEGSPEQIQKVLTQMYKEEYIQEWRKFLQGMTVVDFRNFDSAVTRLNYLGDPVNSPINKLMTNLYEETSWDNPSLVNAGIQKTQRGFTQWIRETILRQAPPEVNLNVNIATAKSQIPMGPIGKEFAMVAKLTMTHSGNKDVSLLGSYLNQLSRIRTRFNQMKNQGDPGPVSRQLMQQTLEGSGSELADALRFVDEQMLTGMTDNQKTSIRPLLVRPLMQAYAVIVKPTEDELNKTWSAQVYEPFSKTLSLQYPFATDSHVEASPVEIAQIFGPDAAIAKYVQSTMGPLVVKRGNTIAARTWADMGVNLTSEFTNNFARWVVPLAANGTPGTNVTGAEAQTVFQIQPLPASGLTEYTIDIDGQTVRYRNTQSDWVNLVWPNPQGHPGARITGITYDGRTVEFLNEPGRYGLQRLIESAQREKKNGTFQLSWKNRDAQLSISLRIISSPGTGRDSGQGALSQTTFRGMQLPSKVTGERALIIGAAE